MAAPKFAMLAAVAFEDLRTSIVDVENVDAERRNGKASPPAEMYVASSDGRTSGTAACYEQAIQPLVDVGRDAECPRAV